MGRNKLSKINKKIPGTKNIPDKDAFKEKNKRKTPFYNLELKTIYHVFR